MLTSFPWRLVKVRSSKLVMVGSQTLDWARKSWEAVVCLGKYLIHPSRGENGGLRDVWVLHMCEQLCFDDLRNDMTCQQHWSLSPLVPWNFLREFLVNQQTRLSWTLNHLSYLLLMSFKYNGQSNFLKLSDGNDTSETSFNCGML